MNPEWAVIAIAPAIEGTVRSSIQYANGDIDGEEYADELYKAGRKSAVAVGGAAGTIEAGLPGAAIGGICGGLAVDTVASVAMGKPKGYWKDVDKMAKGAQHGEFRVDAAGNICLQAGFDAANGIGTKKVASYLVRGSWN